MSSPSSRLAARAALLALLVVPVWGCSAGTEPGPPGGSGGEKPSPSSTTGAGREGLGDIFVGGRAVTGSRPSGNAKVPYRRTYVDGELYSAVTGYRSMAFSHMGLEGVYDGVLTGRPGGGKSGVGDVMTTIDPDVQRAAGDGLRGHKGAAVAMDAENGHLLALVSAPSYDPSSFAGNTTADAEAWQRLTGDQGKPLLNRALREAVAPDETFEVVVAAAALERGVYASVDESTRSPLPYALPGSGTELPSDPARCRNASIRNALRYSCRNVFMAMAVEVGQPRLVSTAKAFGFNDDALLVPVRVGRSDCPEGDVSARDAALIGTGRGGVTATPVQMARVMAVIANGGKRVDPQLVSKVVHADGRVEKPRRAAGAHADRVIGRRTAEQLQSALKTSASGPVDERGGAPGAMIGGRTGWVPPARSYGDVSSAWFISYARSGQGRLVAFAVHVGDSADRVDGADGARPAVRVAERMSGAAAATRG
ncbi:penicillin-binding transpeptidase domain-containing protein [Streptomyces sp. NPDC058316]|uniref:penicillin-binding transpeptidase domain-containing protein n=1 Tax=Streptomyces sp. NPDC058316 TaxID=3346442 RepID=UPI0036E5C8DC